MGGLRTKKSQQKQVEADIGYLLSASVFRQDKRGTVLPKTLTQQPTSMRGNGSSKWQGSQEEGSSRRKVEDSAR